MPEIQVEVKKRIPRQTDNIKYIFGNGDYTVRFAFDSEWAAYPVKTARFCYGGSFTDVVFQGDVCQMPRISQALRVYVGVFAGESLVTQGVELDTAPSIRSPEGDPAEPETVVYDAIMEAVNGISLRLEKVESSPPGTAEDLVQRVLEALPTWNGGAY